MLVKCPECKKSISDAAPACPHCGMPMDATSREKAAVVTKEVAEETKKAEKPGCVTIGCGLLLALFAIGLIVELFWNTVGIH